jgi:hypothetical protein
MALPRKQYDLCSSPVAPQVHGMASKGFRGLPPNRPLARPAAAFRSLVRLPRILKAKDRISASLLAFMYLLDTLFPLLIPYILTDFGQEKRLN